MTPLRSSIKKDELKAFKKIKKQARMLLIINDGNETFLDPIVDKLATYMDLHFQCDDFMKELCK